jgi:hypothetical protein
MWTNLKKNCLYTLYEDANLSLFLNEQPFSYLRLISSLKSHAVSVRLARQCQKFNFILHEISYAEGEFADRLSGYDPLGRYLAQSYLLPLS